VDTISTELGEVIGSTAMTSLPLDGRSYTDLLALQPGVVPTSNESTNTMTGYSNSPPSGGLNDGTLSISGARGSSSEFMVNGGNVGEQLANGTSIIPNVDPIDEFRIITNNFDAEYGAYSGGLINVITKAGTNRFHGNAFYNDLEAYVNANGNGDAPYGLYWVAPTPAMFAAPYVDLFTGNPGGSASRFRQLWRTLRRRIRI
jgi:hypothetical protein